MWLDKISCFEEPLCRCGSIAAASIARQATGILIADTPFSCYLASTNSFCYGPHIKVLPLESFEDSIAQHSK